jgi:large subunit ribosomal protein L32e
MPEDAPEPAAESAPAPATPTVRRRRRSEATKAEPAPAAPEPKAKKADDAPKAPRRATLSPELAALLGTRGYLNDKRPRFVRQAAHRYYRIGRDDAWRRPRGQQSKQRRHYGYRSEIVSVGYRSPAAVRGLTPGGFRPVIVRTRDDLDGLDVHRDAAVIARTVGTRRRLVLEEEARRLGIHVLNPIVRGEGES